MTGMVVGAKYHFSNCWSPGIFPQNHFYVSQWTVQKTENVQWAGENALLVAEVRKEW